MLIISQNLSNYEVDIPKDAIFRINLAWINNLKDGLNNIFMYCINGLTIAPLIVGVYMIKYGSVTKYDVPVILKSKNNEILLNIDDYPNLLC